MFFFCVSDSAYVFWGRTDHKYLSSCWFETNLRWLHVEVYIWLAEGADGSHSAPYTTP